ncbi:MULTISPECIES: CBS domain-containing protein [Dethiosulfovibrio]|uniref:CBS domain-containing protein n=2 Tax=Dethiosulfovibrio TaxID=47054 RepID=A0ABS9EQF6_9BACT|nr:MULTISPECIES: CBS domain-containing protein [Dethiosulfovibrio]MCF4113583.1 CBS domain-containing protein [Dethiosulfovibrio russensis]MCF4142053.1 CBS domain-containing protein [Dethiosulfovibrio marinus]MCF4144208.1 CBS domain-containing protein [Dethiosulfovibrio acidaminovorans]
MKTIVAEDIMSRDLTAVMSQDRVFDAIHVLYSHGLSGLPVIDDDWRLVGYLSESDILKPTIPTYLEILAQSTFFGNEENLLFQRFGAMKNDLVKDFMQKDPVFVSPDTSIMTVADMMLRKKFKRLPVTEEGKLIGIIDRGAFCEFLMEGGIEGVSPEI